MSDQNTAAQSSWIEASGMGCPVSQHSVVDIVRRDGSLDHGPAGFWDSKQRYQNSWLHNGGNCDIVRYRHASPATEIIAQQSAALAQAEAA